MFRSSRMRGLFLDYAYSPENLSGKMRGCEVSVELVNLRFSWKIFCETTSRA